MSSRPIRVLIAEDDADACNHFFARPAPLPLLVAATSPDADAAL